MESELLFNCQKLMWHRLGNPGSWKQGPLQALFGPVGSSYLEEGSRGPSGENGELWGWGWNSYTRLSKGIWYFGTAVHPGILIYSLKSPSSLEEGQQWWPGVLVLPMENEAQKTSTPSNGLIILPSNGNSGSISQAILKLGPRSTGNRTPKKAEGEGL